MPNLWVMVAFLPELVELCHGEKMCHEVELTSEVIAIRGYSNLQSCV